MQLGPEPRGEGGDTGRSAAPGKRSQVSSRRSSWLQVAELFLAEGSDRLKLLVLYSGEEEERLRQAASGALAVLTSLLPPICTRIPQVVSVARLPLPSLGVEERLRRPVQALDGGYFLWGGWLPQYLRGLLRVRSTDAVVVPFPQTVHWLEILQALLLSPSPELQHRGVVVVRNMVAADKEVAAKLMESETLEILSVLASAEDKPGAASVAKECLAQAVSYGLIKPGPDGAK